MAEIWDVYDEEGKKTGKTMSRGVPTHGEYMLCVHVYLHTPNGKFLVQKRSKSKESHPGVWDVTGGAVLCGEESFDGAKRETLERKKVLPMSILLKKILISGTVSCRKKRWRKSGWLTGRSFLTCR